MPSKPFSYREYLATVDNNPTIRMYDNSEWLIKRYQSPEYDMSVLKGAVFLVEFTTKKYIHISESVFSVFGYSVMEFKERTLDEYQASMHPSDFEILNKKVFLDNLKFLDTIEPERYRDFVFSYNYRVRNFQGEYISLLQRFSYIPSNKRAIPFGMIGVGFNITHFKNDISVVHTIEESIIQDGELMNKLIYKKIYPVYDDEFSDCLGKKELEVLELLSKGLGSKQIADKMRISINTVHNHRRNMLLKTNSKSSAELMNYAAKHGLL
jgi:DNA-binding CsgD family transcriptional regulator